PLRGRFETGSCPQGAPRLLCDRLVEIAVERSGSPKSWLAGIAIEIADVPEGACGFSDGTKTANAAFGPTRIKTFSGWKRPLQTKNPVTGSLPPREKLLCLPLDQFAASYASLRRTRTRRLGAKLSNGPPRVSSAQA